MFVFPSMLAPAAEQAGISVPPFDKASDQFDADAFPHFNLFCCAQLARPMSPGEHWENAKVIARIPLADVKTITVDGLRSMGFVGL